MSSALLEKNNYGKRLLSLLRRNVFLPLGATIFALLTLIWGCTSSGSEGSYRSQYPTLAEHAQMQEEHFQIFLKDDRVGAYGRPITIDSAKDMTIGARINTAASSFIVQPIFDLALLSQDSYLDANFKSSTQAGTEIKLVSNKKATAHSAQEKYDFTASGHGRGFKGSSAYHQENKRQESSSDGTVNVTMSYNTTGGYVELITSGFDGDANFTPYLIGLKLDAATVKSYVDYTESYVTGQSGDKYISTLLITNGGQLPSRANVYGNIQLLGEMERVFGLLKTQYNKYSDANVRSILMANMLSLKNSIANAIKTFYSYNGDSFVSRISAMNYGLGNGQLKFGESSGNTENIYSGALSVSYSGLGFGGSASADVGVSRQNGWASAYKNTTVEAVSLPAGVIDTTAWVTSIFAMLNNESSPISVPALGLPVLGTLTLPPPADVKKDPAMPPDTCLQSYDDWKKYQDDKKTSSQQDKEQAAAAGGNVAGQGVQQAMNPASAGNQQLYQDYATELRALKKRRQVSALPVRGDDNNIMRVDKMFVSGFRTTTYDRVIPQLRPNLDIPDQSTKIAGFPNISTLLMVVDKLGQLNSYLNFLSGFAVSKLSTGISGGYDTFYAGFTDAAFDMISMQLMQGVDISDKMLASFSVSMLGQEGSEHQSGLYQAIGNIDAYNYILKTLLAPDNAKIWSSAPGGYIPFAWDGNGQLCFYNLQGIYSDLLTLSHSLVPYTDPMKNPLSFYEENNLTIKSPWFPIFQYNQSLPANLLFLQVAGPYQIIRGFTYAAYPNKAMTFSQMNPVVNASVTPPLVDFLSQSGNSYLSYGEYDAIDWDYSLYFPKATQKDPDMVKKYNVLTLPIQTGEKPPNPPGVMGNYKSVFTPASLNNAWQSGSGAKQIYKTSGGGYIDIIDMNVEMPYKQLGAILLLPINSTTCGDKFNNAFSYATNFTSADIVQDNSYEAAYKAALMK